jgi:putative IMPACT (imprinted ancient) family translation regulator
VQEGLNNCQIMEKSYGVLLNVRTDYNFSGKLQYLFAQQNITVMDSEYGADVLFRILVPEDEKTHTEKEIVEQTCGSARLEWGESIVYGILDGKVQQI